MSALDNLDLAVGNFSTAKLDSTAKLTSAVQKFNTTLVELQAMLDATPHSILLIALVNDFRSMASELSALVSNFNAMTAQSDIIRSSIKSIQSVVAPDGMAALPPFGVIIDKFQEAWSFGDHVGSDDYAILKDHAAFQGAAAALLTIKDGLVWGLDSANNWWTADSTGKWVTSLAGPWGQPPADLRSFNTQDGATIGFSAPNSSGYLVDMNAARWSNGAFAPDGKNFVITRNGIPFSEPGFTTQPYAGVMLHLKNGIVYIQDAAGSWVYPPV